MISTKCHCESIHCTEEHSKQDTECQNEATWQETTYGLLLCNECEKFYREISITIPWWKDSTPLVK